MKPAARVTDMHTCPMVSGTVPHVGGPILPPGAVTVLVAGLPAARVGDMAVCVGPPDSIVMGSTGVFVEGRPFARLGDRTAHGGVIVAGCPTVLVGDVGGGAASLQGLTMSAAKKAGAPFTKMKCDQQDCAPIGSGVGAVRVAKTSPRKAPAVAGASPAGGYPRAVRLADGGHVTEYSRFIRLAGTPEEQANGIKQLDAIHKHSSGKEMLDKLDAGGKAVTLSVHGDVARGYDIHPDPAQQSYQNCAVQSAQQLIRQATGKNYSEAEMEALANDPGNSGYDRNRGTPIKGIKTVLKNGWVKAGMVGAKPKTIQKAITKGKGVITAHDAGKLWNDAGSLGAGHAVVTTGFLKDENGNTLAYVINDTGTGDKARTVPAAQYEGSLMKGKTVTVTKKKIW